MSDIFEYILHGDLIFILPILQQKQLEVIAAFEEFIENGFLLFRERKVKAKMFLLKYSLRLLSYKRIYE